jgi:hypothetical protein
MQISKSWLVLLSSAGYGVIFSMALVGGVRIAGALSGTPLSDTTANTIFGIGALVLVPVLTYFRFASLFVWPSSQVNS